MAASVAAGVSVGVNVELGVGVGVVPLTTLAVGGVTVGFKVGDGVGTGFSVGVGDGVGAAVRGGGAPVCVCGAALTMRGRVFVDVGAGFTDCAPATSGGIKASTHTDTIFVSKVGWFFIKLQASQAG